MFLFKDTCPFLTFFERSTADIRKEYEAVCDSIRMRTWPEAEKFAGSWQVFGLYHGGRKMKSCCERAPFTTELIEGLAELGCTKVTMAGFSRMSAGTDILPHVDDVAIKNRIHLGLKVPEGDCGFEVDGLPIKWQEGRAFMFDPTKIHRAWNKTQEDRVVFLVDFQSF